MVERIEGDGEIFCRVVVTVPVAEDLFEEGLPEDDWLEDQRRPRIYGMRAQI